MPGATGADGTEAFAQLLRELKDRSGLSYGTLAKRLHMSTSTLHRYCNGTAVPVEYAPVERLARVCRAAPEELVELHRRWILADAARGSRAEQVAVDPGLPSSPAPDAGDDEDDKGTEQPEGTDEPVVTDVPREPASPSRRRRTVLIAAVAVAAVLGAVALSMPFSGGHDTGGDRAAGDSALITGTPDAGNPSLSPSPSATGHKPSASASRGATESPAPSQSGGRQGGGRQADGGASTAVPLTVGTRPYVYDQPCSQHFLVDSGPDQVGPPASEPDAPRWAAAYGAVSAGEQEVALTVQGTGAETVVLEALHVRVLSASAPPAWNKYAMGDGCGGGVETKAFDVDLDNGSSPAVTVKGGQRDFPYKVSESDPEVFYVVAHTKAHDIRWDLTLDWSSGSRRGTVHIDNAGTPFRTASDVGRPSYVYPLGGSEWIKEES
ncbi:helix-turn-helix domain-containing protein [Streptomyces coacervatus]|uniref:transcriptional regulator n=1 Tax=Streptomyces coacervatus TaxID=647381 RepID=UPI0023DCD473|nr:transcriptional regulator [Streptomyces coacervatus]MDF2270995.1 helix-turn-helix domain-containing protein [Streptomyces coacervatus]